MGGRYSNFSINPQTGEFLMSESIPIPLIEDDSISERNNEYIDILQDKNHIVCCSTDNFNYDLIEPNLRKLNKLIDKFPAIRYNLKENEILIRGATFDDPRTSACFGHLPSDKQNMTIYLNKDYFTLPKNEVISVEEYERKIGHFSPCDKEEYITATLSHEYGHFIEKLIIEKKLRNDENLFDKDINERSREYKMQAVKIKNEILNIQKERFGLTNDQISEYGKVNSREFFAESFANLVNSKNPTTIAKATEIYIKENL